MLPNNTNVLTFNVKRSNVLTSRRYRSPNTAGTVISSPSRETVTST